MAADLLLTLGDVARSRFHVPPAMLSRILELADPVATCADDRLRFEAFSACCSVYGRVDLLPDAYRRRDVGRGTTNVDFGAAMRAALAGVEERSRLGLTVGAAAVEVDADGDVRGRATGARCRRAGCAASSRSRRSRPSSAPCAELDAVRARAFLRSIPKSPSKRGRSGSAGGSRPADLPSRSRSERLGLAGLARLAPVRSASPATRRRSASSPPPGTAAPAGSSTSRAPA